MKKVMMLALAASLVAGTTFAGPALNHVAPTTKPHTEKKAEKAEKKTEKKDKKAEKKANQKKAALSKSADKHS